MKYFTAAALTVILSAASFAEAPERAGLATMGGNPVVLLGASVAVGDPAPDFAAVDAQWKTVRLSDLKGKVVILSSVPSLDTKVCSIQTRRFDKEAQALGKDGKVAYEEIVSEMAHEPDYAKALAAAKAAAAR